MNGARPELVFVAGPQEGERAVLMGNMVLLGRSPAADVRLAEGATSREQLRFQLTPDGWLMQNLSANGTVVNGKRYKRKKQLILETGDVLGVGLETEILYVSPADDPEEALAAFREKRPAGPPESKAALTPSEPAETPRTQQKKKAGPPPLPAEKKKDRETEADEGEAAPSDEEKSGKLKYVLGGIVMVSLVLFGAAIIKKSMDKSGGILGPSGPPRLRGAEISEALAAPLEGKSLSPTKAAVALDRAVRSYQNRNLWEEGDLFRCVKDFKFHLAYRGTQSFDRIQHENMFAKATEELDETVRQKYSDAWKFCKARSFRKARAAFEELLAILPVKDLDREGQIYKVIIPNVIDHLKHVKANMGKVREY